MISEYGVVIAMFALGAVSLTIGAVLHFTRKKG